MTPVPRVPDVIEDRTALDGSRIDVAARIGWLLRASRTARGVSLRSMVPELRAVGLRTSVTALSRLETEGQRSGAVIDGYEQVLGLPPGRLRAAVDVLCRTFDYAPADQEPFARPPDLHAFSEAVAAVEESPTGGDWLRFAGEHGGGRGFGVTAGQMETGSRGSPASWAARSEGPTSPATRRWPGCAAAPTPTSSRTSYAASCSTRPPRSSTTS